MADKDIVFRLNHYASVDEYPPLTDELIEAAEEILRLRDELESERIRADQWKDSAQTAERELQSERFRANLEEAMRTDLANALEDRGI